MRAALVVTSVTEEREANVAYAADAIVAAAYRGADLVLLPEMAVTGFIDCGDAEHDLPQGEVIPGPLTYRFAALARRCGLHLGLGLLERAGCTLYDSAVLLSPAGQIVLHYRRMQPQWHRRNADPAVYRQGLMVTATDTPLGRFAFLICGDLFDDSVVAKAGELRPDWLLFPFARCFDGGAPSQERWDTDELPDYLAQVQKVACTALMVNYCSAPAQGGYFGGALVVSPAGEVMAALPLGAPGTLLVDLSRSGPEG